MFAGYRKDMVIIMQNWKPRLIKSLKIAIAAVAAIAVAGELGLKYSATAGIITVLSIQNTKKETLRSARNRGFAFLCALLLAGGCFGVLGFTLWAFVLYLFLFALLCQWAGWQEALAMDSVLITHFLSEKSMAPMLLVNESLLFFIGTGFGILVNLHLRRKGAEFERLAAEVDEQIKGILHRMSLWLPVEDKSSYGSGCFQTLKKALEEAKLCAAANYNNDLRNADTYELDYIRMREQQSVVLQEIYENIKSKGIRGVNFVSPNGDVVEICYDNARSYAGKSGLLGWDHLAIRTKDIKESMAFYAGLGFAMTGNGYLDTDEGRLYIAFMTCKGFTVELIQLVGAAVEDPDTWKTGKIDHIALDVENVQDAFMEARSKGYELVDYGIQELPLFAQGCRYFSIKGPSGEKIEFNQLNKF